MGYSHYWYQAESYDPILWEKVITDFNTILDLEDFRRLLDRNPESGQRLQITEDVIWFNGKPPEDHETFSLYGKMSGYELARAKKLNETCDNMVEVRVVDGVETRTPIEPDPIKKSDHPYFGSCKTSYKPYDLVVMCCLIIAKSHLGNSFDARSDGDVVEWQQAREICEKHLGIKSLIKNGDLYVEGYVSVTEEGIFNFSSNIP